jgi:hypothetical protein
VTTNTYLHRLDAIAARLGTKPCGDQLCVKCCLAKLHADLQGGEWSGCDGLPVTLTQLFAALSDAELAQGRGAT